MVDVVRGLYVRFHYLIYLMTAINKNQDTPNKVGLSQYPNPIPDNSATKHRNIFTAKLRPRTVFNSGKSLKPMTNGTLTHSIHPQEAELVLSPKEEEVALKQFDHLQLEDFLKVVIVGKNKISETKSKEIIRSLNGTWFRNTDSLHPVSRLYCSLPIKKHRSTTAKREQTSRPSLGEHFYKNYTPPNLFPKRKVTPRKASSSQLRNEFGKDIEDVEIRGQLLKKITSFRDAEPRPKRRASSYFSGGKSGPLKFFQQANGCLLGKKMVIHD